MASEPPKVLISYSHDSQKHTERVLELANRLRADGIDCMIDQYVLVPEEGWPLWMERQIRGSKFVLMVCTESYYRRVMDEEEPGKGLGVRWEGRLIYDAIYRAETRKTKFIPVLFEADDSSHIPGPVGDTNFYLVQTQHGYEDLYRRITNQQRLIKPELGKLRSLPSAERKSEGALGKLHGVPDLPPHYLPREEHLVGLKRKLLAGMKSVATTGHGQALGVQGMGGIGKTVLAAALAHDSEVRQAFPDGIYWLTLGQKPNLLDLQNRLSRQLTGSTETLTTEQEAKDALREALESRTALVVVDDAWTIDDAATFSVTSLPTRLLITTRNNEVLVGLGAEEHRVDVLLPTDALKMLTEWVGEKSPDKLPPEATEVAKECGYLPLALAMIGAMVRLRPTAWKDALGRLQRADLEAVKRAFPGYPYPDLLRAIEVSVDGMESADRERYLDLAVFPEDQTIPEEALGVLWNLDEADTRDCITRLVARSLATWATRGTSIILHDLQRDLIHKRREKDLPALHLKLVEAWDGLPKLPDAYAWRWVAYHMVKAGRKDDLRRLLLDFDYLQAKLSSTDPSALIADYDRLADDEELRLIQSALRLSAHVLDRNASHLANQLIGRLLGIGRPDIQDFLQKVSEKAPCPWLRPMQANLTPPGSSLIRTLEGHTDRVRAVALSGDGRRAVSASVDRTLRLWDLETDRTLCTLEGHEDWVMAVALSADGRRALSGSADRTLRLWDLETGQTVRTLEGHTDRVMAVALSADGLRALSGSVDKTLRFWDLETGQTLRTLEGHADRVWAVALSADGLRALSASFDRTLRLWDLKTGQTMQVLEGHAGWVTALALSADGRAALSGSVDKTLRLWDLETGQTLHTLEGHEAQVRAATFTPDGCCALSGGDDRTLRLWDLKTGQTLRTLKGHTDRIQAVALSADGLRALSGGDDGTLRLWDLEINQALGSLENHTNGVSAVALSGDGRRAVCAWDDGILRLWELETGQIVSTLEAHTAQVQAVALSADGRRAALAGNDWTLRLVDLETGQTRILESHTGEAWELALSADGRCAVSASVEQIQESLSSATLEVWDLKTGQTLRTLVADFVEAMALSGDGRRAVWMGNDPTLRVWDLETGQMLRVLEGHTALVWAVTLSADGRRVVSGGDDRTLRLWDLETGQTLRTLEGPTDRVRAVVFSPDGRGAVWAQSDMATGLWELDSGQFRENNIRPRLGWFWGVALSADGRRAVSADDYNLQVWDLETGQTLRTLQGHTDRVNAVAVTPDGRRAVSASGDQMLRLWDLETGQTLAALESQQSWVTALALGADGRRVVSAESNQALRLWDLNSGQTRTLRCDEYSVTALALSANGRRVVSAGGSILRVWDFESSQILLTLLADPVKAMVLSGDGRRAVSAGNDPTLRVWDLETGQMLRALEGHKAQVRAVALSADGLRALSGGDDQILRLWDLETGQALRTLEGHKAQIRAVVFSPDGHRAVSASDDATLRFWELGSGETLRTLWGHTAQVRAVALSADGRRALSGSVDKTLRLWDLESGQVLSIRESHRGPVYAVALSADSATAVSASDNERRKSFTLRVWDLDSGQIRCTLDGHPNGVRAVAVTADGRRAVSNSDDKTLRLWDLETGQMIRTLEGYENWLSPVVLSADCRRALSGGTLRVWDLDSGQIRCTLHCAYKVNAVALGADGRRAVSACNDGLRVWDVDIGEEIAAFIGESEMHSCAIAPDGHTIVCGEHSGRVHFLRLVEADETKPSIANTKISLLQC